jgi:hypothetical protein
LIPETASFNSPKRHQKTRSFLNAFKISRNSLYLWTQKCILKQGVSISVYTTVILVISLKIRTEDDTLDFTVGFFPTRNISIFGVTSCGLTISYLTSISCSNIPPPVLQVLRTTA